MLIKTGIFATCFLFVILPAVLAECAPFYDSLNSLSSISSNNGVVNGQLSFVQGVNNNAASFNQAYVRYTGNMFNTEKGSVSFWFRKNSDDASGGIFQIGTIGTKNSLGIFYSQDSLYFEIQNSLSYNQILSPHSISQAKFTHVTATWEKRGSAYFIKLFVNGKYASGSSLDGLFIHNPGFMDIGRDSFYGYGEGVIDELRFFNWQLSDPEVYAEYIYSSNRFRKAETSKPVSTGNIKIAGNSLEVNGKPFLVKGVGYQPIPIGLTNDVSTLNSIYTNPKVLERDAKFLRQMNANTVRLWAELSNSTLLDYFYNSCQDPIYVIMAFEVPTNLDYKNPSAITSLENEFRAYVKKFKEHPGVLAWAIGNENNLHYKGNISDWYVLANRLAKVAYDEEKPRYHPTILVNGYMLYFGDIDYKSDDISLNYIDLWGHNSYVGYDYHCYFDYYNKISAKPLIVTEFGIDALNYTYGTYENIQAEWDINQWKQIKANSAGGALMEYSDEWWKLPGASPSYHNPGGYYTDVQPDSISDEEWWGIMAVEKNSSIDIMHPRQVYYALKEQFALDNKNGECTVFCSDSDSGKNYYIKGATKGLNSAGIYAERTDSCSSDGKYVNEFYCENNIVKYTAYTCKAGCQNGACKPVCSDSDGGKIYTIKGTTKGLNSAGTYVERTDSCSSDGKYVNEFYCEKNIVKYVPYTCSKTCSNGICLK